MNASLDIDNNGNINNTIDFFKSLIKNKKYDQIIKLVREGFPDRALLNIVISSRSAFDLRPLSTIIFEIINNYPKYIPELVNHITRKPILFPIIKNYLTAIIDNGHINTILESLNQSTNSNMICGLVKLLHDKNIPVDPNKIYRYSLENYIPSEYNLVTLLLSSFVGDKETCVTMEFLIDKYVIDPTIRFTKLKEHEKITLIEYIDYLIRNPKQNIEYINSYVYQLKRFRSLLIK